MQRLGAGTLTEIVKEAAAWLIEMDLEPERWDRRAFAAWLKSSPRHMEEFLNQSALWVALHGVNAGGVDVHQLLNDSGNIVDWPKTQLRPEQGTQVTKRRWWWLTSLAAAMLIFASAVVWNLIQGNATVLTTAVGEQRAVRLIDRSVVHLNTDSRVEIRFTETVREVRLLQGEALFTVERDVNRPFRVHSDGIQVEALGTQFNVRRRAGDTIVSVVEGRVAVVRPTEVSRPFAVTNQSSKSAGRGTNELEPSARPLNVPYDAERPAPAGTLTMVQAGEQVRVLVNGTIEEKRSENVTAATAWRQRQLVFSNTPLADVAAEVARYNTTPRLQIEGDALQARQLNGVFAADDPESLIQFLQRDAGLFVSRSGDTVVIRSR